MVNPFNFQDKSIHYTWSRRSQLGRSEFEEPRMAITIESQLASNVFFCEEGVLDVGRSNPSPKRSRKGFWTLIKDNWTTPGQMRQWCSMFWSDLTLIKRCHARRNRVLSGAAQWVWQYFHLTSGVSFTNTLLAGECSSKHNTLPLPNLRRRPTYMEAVQDIQNG